MSRLIYKGDTIENFGKVLPVPYIERIEIRNPIKGEHPTETWLDADVLSIEAWTDDQISLALDSMTKLTVKLSIYFNSDENVEENPHVLWNMLKNNLNLNVLCLRGESDKSPITHLIKSKKNIKRILTAAGDASLGVTSMFGSDQYSAAHDSSVAIDLSDAQLDGGYASWIERAQFHVMNNTIDDPEGAKKGFFFGFPLSAVATGDHIIKTPDFDVEFNRIIKISGIEIELFVPTIEADGNVALFVGTSAFPLADNMDLNDKVLALGCSDFAYEYIRKNNQLATKNNEGFFDVKTGDFYTGHPLRALNKKYYKTEDFGRDEIVKNIQAATNKYRKYATIDPDVEKQILNIMYIVARYGDDVNLLNEFNEYRKIYPDKTAATKTGELYESFKIALENSNTLLRRQDQVIKKQFRNIKIRDLRPFQYANVFNPSYRGPDPPPGLDAVDVPLEHDDLLYPTVLQTTIAKYQPEGVTHFETELAYDTDEIRDAAADAINALLDGSFRVAMMFDGTSEDRNWGANKIQDIADYFSEHSIKPHRDQWTRPESSVFGVGGLCAVYECSANEGEGGDPGGVDYFCAARAYRNMCGREGSGNADYGWDSNPPARGTGGLGRAGKDGEVELIVTRHDSTYGATSMRSGDRGLFINKSITRDGETKTCQSWMNGWAGTGLTDKTVVVREAGCNGPVLNLRVLKNMSGYDGNFGGTTVIGSRRGTGRDWDLNTDDQMNDMIRNAITNDAWGPFVKVQSQKYANESSDNMTTSTKRAEPCLTTVGAATCPSGDGYVFEFRAIIPAMRTAFHKIGFRADSNDPYGGATVNNAHGGSLFWKLFNGDLIGALGMIGRTTSGRSSDEWWQAIQDNDDNLRHDIANKIWSTMYNDTMDECQSNIIECWGHTTTYKMQYPYSTGHGMYGQEEGNAAGPAESGGWAGMYYYSYNFSQGCAGSTRSCGTYTECWGANYGMHSGFGGDWYATFRYGCHQSAAYESDTGNMMGLQSGWALNRWIDNFHAHTGWPMPDHSHASAWYGGRGFHRSGFPASGVGWTRCTNTAPPGVASWNFGNEILYQTTQHLNRIAPTVIERVDTILQYMSVTRSTNIDAGVHDKLAHVDIIANKYGWFFFDLEKYHRQYSNISKYINVPMMLSYYPEMRELMNFTIAPSRAEFRYWPVLSNNSITSAAAAGREGNAAMKLTTDLLTTSDSGHPSNPDDALSAPSGFSDIYMDGGPAASCSGYNLIDMGDPYIDSGEFKELMASRPPWCKVTTFNVAGWKDLKWDAVDAQMETAGGDSAGVSNQYSYLMLRNLDFAFTDNAANVAANADSSTYGEGITGVDAGYVSSVPDNYRLLTFNYNFYVDDDLATFQKDLVELEVSIVDHSIELLRIFSSFFEEVYNNFIENYYELAIENCAFDNLSSQFNNFFADEMQRRYVDKLEHAPWFAAPAIYAVYRDIFQNAYGGDTFLMTDDARSISDSINPRTGFLDALIGFKQQMESFYEHLVEVVENADDATSDDYLPRLYTFKVGEDNEIIVDQAVIDIVADISDPTQSVTSGDVPVYDIEEPEALEYH